MNDHIPKPVDPAQLTRALATWLPQAVRAEERGSLQTGLTHGDVAELAPLRALPGLALDVGLRSCRGKVAQLRKLLLRFAADHAADMDKVRTDLAQQDWVAAERRVHTLKGVAGMLGWVMLQREAQAVEQLLKQHGTDVQPVLQALPSLEMLLQDAVRATQALAPAPATAPEVPLDWPALETALAQLRTLLETDDLDAAEVYERVAPMLACHLPEHARALGAAVEHYDFAQATEALHAMMASAAWQALQTRESPAAP